MNQKDAYDKAILILGIDKRKKSKFKYRDNVSAGIAAISNILKCNKTTMYYYNFKSKEIGKNEDLFDMDKSIRIEKAVKKAGGNIKWEWLSPRTAKILGSK